MCIVVAAWDALLESRPTECRTDMLSLCPFRDRGRAVRTAWVLAENTRLPNASPKGRDACANTEAGVEAWEGKVAVDDGHNQSAHQSATDTSSFPQTPRAHRQAHGDPAGHFPWVHLMRFRCCQTVQGSLAKSHPTWPKLLVWSAIHPSCPGRHGARCRYSDVPRRRPLIERYEDGSPIPGLLKLAKCMMYAATYVCTCRYIYKDYLGNMHLATRLLLTKYHRSDDRLP